MRKLNKFFIQNSLKARLLLVVLACLIGASFFVVKGISPDSYVHAQTEDNYGLNSEFQNVAIQSDRDIKQIIALIINIFLGFLGIIAVLLILYAGYMWMTAGGNEDQVAKAKLILRNAVIGLAIILSAWMIASFIINQLSSATGGGGGGGGNGPVVPLPDNPEGTEFLLEKFQTRHAGEEDNQDVYQCSNIESIFNHWVSSDTVSQAIESGDIKILRTKENIEPNGTGGTELENPELIDLMRIASFSNSIGFELDQQEEDENALDDWQQFSEFEVRVPGYIANYRGLPLAPTGGENLSTKCRANPSCDYNAEEDYYAWKFWVTDENDEQAPSITSADPQIIGTENYPDRNVNRSPLLRAYFNEPIYGGSFKSQDNHFIDSTVRVERIASAEDTAEGDIIPVDHFDVSSLSHGDGFEFWLNENHVAEDGEQKAFESFTWYRITVQNIKDMCGNPMQGAVSWVFHTNDVLPGIASVYPPNDYSRSCPSTKVSIRFKTSMYNIQTKNCSVHPETGGLVLSGNGVDGRRLRVLDPVGDDLPKDKCMLYAFEPIEGQDGELFVDKTYAPQVSFFNSASGSVETTNVGEDAYQWNFTVKSADQCVDMPYIASVRPSYGKWGQCLTISGWNFGSATGSVKSKLITEQNRAGKNFRFDNQEVLLSDDIVAYWNTGGGINGLDIGIGNWTEDVIVGDLNNLSSDPGLAFMPAGSTDAVQGNWTGRSDDLDIDLSVHVAVGDIDGDGHNDILTSEPYKFYINSDKTYAGPCLYYASPSSGYWGDDVTLYGKNLKSKVSGDHITFYPGKLQNVSEVGSVNWTDTQIKTKVPQLAQDNPDTTEGEVFVTIGPNNSNKVNYDIAAGIGKSCSITQSCTVDSRDSSICRDDLECRYPSGEDPDPLGCTCQVPNRFEIKNPAPNCAESCVNAEISIGTNKPIDLGTINGNVLMKKCGTDDACAWNLATDLAPPITAANDGDFKVKINYDGFLDINSRYRVVIYGGDNGLKKAIDGKIIFNTNYKADNIDSYSWIFGTSNRKCAVDRLVVSPSSALLYGTGTDKEDFSIIPYSNPSSCSASGQQLNPNNLLTEGVFSWSAKKRTENGTDTECLTAIPETKLTISNLPDDPIDPNDPYAYEKSVSLTAYTGAKELAWACAEYNPNDAGFSTVRAGAKLTLRAPCVNDNDCKETNPTCNSKCNQQTKKCDPLIKKFTPNNGAAETWVSINGCYFGNDWGEAYIGLGANSDPLRANQPDYEWCGNTWSEREIIASVDANIDSAGLVKIKRKDDVWADSSLLSISNFTKNSTIHPGVCRVSPKQGKSGDIIDIKGQKFGDFSQSNLDDETYSIRFIQGASMSLEKITVIDKNTKSSCPNQGWSDEHVCIRVVADAPLGNSDIRVIRGTEFSNDKSFKVLVTPQPSTSPGDVLIPISNTPSGNLACPNMIVEVILKGKLDIETMGIPLGEGLTSEELANSNFIVREQGQTAALAGTTTAEVFYSKSRLWFIPENGLVANKTYEIILKSYKEGERDGLRSITNGILLAGEGNICANGALDANKLCVKEFKTVDNVQDNQCKLTHLQIEPASPVFTCARTGCAGDEDSAPEHQRIFGAIGINGFGDPAEPTSQIEWASTDEDILSTATPTTPLPPSVAPSQWEKMFDIHSNNGSTIIRANAGAITGSTEARVFLCENPWPASMATNGKPFNDTNEAWSSTDETPKTNFLAFYCRDRGVAGTEDDLPAFPLGNCVGGSNDRASCSVDSQCSSNRCGNFVEFGLSGGVGRSVPGLLKEVFLLQPYSKSCVKGDPAKLGQTCADSWYCNTQGETNGVCTGEVDAIGIRSLSSNTCTQGDDDKIGLGCVFATDCAASGGVCETNPEYFSIQNWYNSQSFEKGSPKSFKIDNNSFDALQDGRTIYVSALNDTLGPEKICTIGDSAKIGQECTENSFCGNNGACTINPSIYKNIYLISINDKAHSDTIEIYNQLKDNWRFLANIDNSDERAKLLRDLKRVDDAYYMVNTLNKKYQAVKLESGSFQKGLSISTWPSWKGAFSTDFGISLPVDPINDIKCASKDSIDQNTCYYPDKQVTSTDPWKFQCDGDSHYYLYKYTDNPVSDPNPDLAVFQFNLEYSTGDDWNNVFVGGGWSSSTSSCTNKEYTKRY